MTESAIYAGEDALFDWPAPLCLENVLVGRRGRAQELEIPHLEVRAGACAHLQGEARGVHLLARVVRLLVPVRAGRVLLFGQDVRRASLAARARVRRRMAVIGADAQLAPMLSLSANIELPARLAGRLNKVAREDVREMVYEFGLEGEAQTLAAAASGPARRACVLARAILARPALLVGDTPFAGISERAQIAAYAALNALREGGASMVFSGLTEAESTQLRANRHGVQDGVLRPFDAGAGR